MKFRFAYSAAALLLAAASARANMLVNGGLETSATPNQYGMVTVRTNGKALTGWTITSGTVDAIPSSYWQAASTTFGDSANNFSLDLVGTPGIGKIQQKVATVKGTTYELTFSFAVNPEDGPYAETALSKLLRIQAIGSNSRVLATQDYTASSTGHSTSDMGWVTQTFTFVANGSSTTLRLAAIAPSHLPARVTSSKIYTGPVIDNLDLEPFTGTQQLPEPASLGVLGAGSLLLLRRRKR